MNQKADKKIDLIELNLNDNSSEKREVKVFKKNETNKKLKKLSEKEIENIKKNIKKQKENKKIAKKIIKKNDDIIEKKAKKIQKKENNKTYVLKNNVDKRKKEVVDVCTIIKKCNIEEITKYLLNEGKNKKFPDITKRQVLMRKLNIAIIGLGNIGSFLFKQLNENRKILTEKNNCLPVVKYVSARNKKKKRRISLGKSIWLDNYLEATKKEDIDLIVELIGGAEGPAKKLVFNALKNKKHVVTANKALIAKYGDDLSKIAEKNKVNLEFEASVCGGVPIIRSLKEGLIANKITKIFGIFNGTSNYILSSMDKENKNFDAVLSNAKKLGYAESNPIADLNGDDVGSKIRILSSLCFHTLIS